MQLINISRRAGKTQRTVRRRRRAAPPWVVLFAGGGVWKRFLVRGAAARCGRYAQSNPQGDTGIPACAPPCHKHRRECLCHIGIVMFTLPGMDCIPARPTALSRPASWPRAGGVGGVLPAGSLCASAPLREKSVVPGDWESDFCQGKHRESCLRHDVII